MVRPPQNQYKETFSGHLRLTNVPVYIHKYINTGNLPVHARDKAIILTMQVKYCLFLIPFPFPPNLPETHTASNSKPPKELRNRNLTFERFVDWSSSVPGATPNPIASQLNSVKIINAIQDKYLITPHIQPMSPGQFQGEKTLKSNHSFHITCTLNVDIRHVILMTHLF